MEGAEGGWAGYCGRRLERVVAAGCSGQENLRCQVCPAISVVIESDNVEEIGMANVAEDFVHVPGQKSIKA